MSSVFMEIAFFSTKPYDRNAFNAANGNYNYDFAFFETKLNHQTASLAKGFTTVCTFVNDIVDRSTLELLAQNETKLLALRCTGYNQVKLFKMMYLSD
jgi:D-lactate dehydrogenase